MSLDDLYRYVWSALSPEEVSELDSLPPPRGPEWIYELIDGLDLPRDSRILDLACGPGRQAVELAERYGATVVAIDPVLFQLVDARKLAGELPVRPAAGRMESIPVAGRSIDMVWLRDALVHSEDPETTLRECHRTLRPGGHLLLYTAFGTDKLGMDELELLEAHMSVSRASLDAERVDGAIAGAGFEVIRTEPVGSELVEHYELEDGLGARALLRLARLERHSAELLERLGEKRFRAARGLYHWIVFEFLGKVSYRASLLLKAE